MDDKGKIAAFTMVDILTGMVITSIIISMVFYLFTGLNKQVADYGGTRSQLNQFLMLRTDLKRQFDQSKAITGIPGGFVVYGPTDEVTYLKEGPFFIRKTLLVTDTLSAGLEELQIVFETNSEGRLTENIASVDISIGINALTLKSSFYKEYGLVERINKKLLHEF